MKRVLIVGAGFGGLWAARTLAKAPVEVVIVDRNNYHTFLALLYQVAAAELEPESIVFPIRGIIRSFTNVRFLLAEVTGVDFKAREVKTNNGSIPYDYLILALGSVTNFFGVAGAEEHTFRLKTLEDAVLLRNHILSCFEKATWERNPERRRKMLTFVIVGGGPTGVEFAGALAELIRGPIRKDYPALDIKSVRVILLEATNSLLGFMPPQLQEYTHKRLERMGVEVFLNACVSRVDDGAVHLADGTTIPTETVVWTAGVRGHPLAAGTGLPRVKNDRVKLLPTLQLLDYPEVYVVGDMALAFDQAGNPVPMVAPAAIQEGIAAAENILRQLRGQVPKPFRYRNPGFMVTIGRNAAVAVIGHRAFKGFIAWLLWLLVHLIRLIGFRNRLLVLINWAWDYLFFERAVRVIFPSGAFSRYGVKGQTLR